MKCKSMFNTENKSKYLSFYDMRPEYIVLFIWFLDYTYSVLARVQVSWTSQNVDKKAPSTEELVHNSIEEH